VPWTVGTPVLVTGASEGPEPAFSRRAWDSIAMTIKAFQPL
jgi:hypothetical protein